MAGRDMTAGGHVTWGVVGPGQRWRQLRPGSSAKPPCETSGCTPLPWRTEPLLQAPQRRPATNNNDIYNHNNTINKYQNHDDEDIDNNNNHNIICDNDYNFNKSHYNNTNNNINNNNNNNSNIDKINSRRFSSS